MCLQPNVPGALLDRDSVSDAIGASDVDGQAGGKTRGYVTDMVSRTLRKVLFELIGINANANTAQRNDCRVYLVMVIVAVISLCMTHEVEVTRRSRWLATPTNL